MILMAKKTITCHNCKHKSENVIKYSINNEKDFWFCDKCYNKMNNDYFIVLEIKYYILKIMELKRGSNTLNERIEMFICDMNKTILLSILKSQHEEMNRYLGTKNFKNNYSKLTYLQKMLETNYNKEFERQQKQDKEMIKEIEFNFLDKRKKIKIRNISSWL